MKLEKIRKISGRIQVKTGLHIGGSTETIEIGGLDNPIIKDPRNGAPYIPGSSLKGKLRSLIELKEGKYVKEGRSKGNPCDCGKSDCPVCPVFGISAKKERHEADFEGPTRIVVRDAHLSKFKENDNAKSWEDEFNVGDLPMEIKYENTVNRITGMANPRPLERVPAGVEFDFNISFKKFENDNESYFKTILKSMRLLELDALGGSGSRGSGQIKFVGVIIDGEKQPDNFLETYDNSL